MLFVFEEYVLDTARRELRVRGSVLAIEPQVFDVLAYLLQNRERVVSPDDLRAAVWARRIVSESTLRTRINAARTAIGDDGHQQRLIRTLTRKGFRFVGEVREEHELVAVTASEVGDRAAEPTTNTAAAPRRATPEETAPIRPDSGSAHALLLDRPSVAVLPFANLGGQQDYFSDGITEDIITELSRFSELQVIARNSTFQFKGKPVDIRQIGRELGARYVLEGGVRSSGERVRITAQLVDTTTGAHRWAERFDRELHDVFAVQDEVARAIVAILAAHVNQAETERTLLKPPAAWEAYECYLRGAEAHSLYLGRLTKASLYDSRRLLEQSIAVDPNYARAYALLSSAHLTAYYEPIDGDYANPVVLDRALELAEMAVQLDSRLPPAHAALGWALLWKRRHDAAVAQFERAFALNPNFIDHQFGLVLIMVGEPARAIEMLETNMRLDPFAPVVFSRGLTGSANYMLGRYAEAVALLSEWTSHHPNLQVPHLWLASAHAQLGEIDEAKAEAAQVLRINPGFTIEQWRRFVVYKYPKDVEHRVEGMRKAGLPES
jgi:adenylate cyclase